MARQGIKETMKGMTGGEKLDYLWTYYKWVLVVAAFAAVVLSMVVTGIVNNSKDILYSGAVVNLITTNEGQTCLTDDLHTALGGVSKQEVELFPVFFQNLQNASDVEVSSYTAMQIVTKVAAQELDYVIMDEAAFSLYENHNIFMPLDTLFPEMVWDENAIYHESEEGTYPIAIDVSNTDFAQKGIIGAEKVYIAFPGNTQRTEQNAVFLEYLLNWNP